MSNVGGYIWWYIGKCVEKNVDIPVRQWLEVWSVVKILRSGTSAFMCDMSPSGQTYFVLP